jgi:hypothetical protein
MRRYARVSRALGAVRVAAGVTAVAALVAFVFGAAAPASAFAPVGSPARGGGPTSFAQQFPFSPVATCGNEFTGHVTVDRGTGNGGEISLDRFSFPNCDSGVTVTVRSLPWTLTVDSSRRITVRGVEIDLTTAQGTCRYAGDLRSGLFDDTLGLYNLSGVVNRRGGGCGVGDTLSLDTSFQETILVNGVGMTL